MKLCDSTKGETSKQSIVILCLHESADMKRAWLYLHGCSYERVCRNLWVHLCL